MGYSIVYLSLFIIVNSRTCFSYTIEELKALNYEVDISQVPVKNGEEQIHPVVHMTSIFGQEYQCLLPLVAEDDTSEKMTYSERNTDIQDLLRPMHTGNCLLKAKDWWTYELCFGRYIKQFHIEDGQIIGQALTLGLYESDYDWNNETDEDKFKHMKQQYHSQYYVNGTKCDLTGQPRVAEVRIFCDEDSGDYIHRVDEPGTCSYVITVHTSRVCSHPQLKPLPSKKAHTIPCHPLLSDLQYSIYIKKLKEEKALAEQERSQWLTTQQVRLEEIKNEFFLPSENKEDTDHDIEVDKIDENQHLLTMKKKFVLGTGSAEEISEDNVLDKINSEEKQNDLKDLTIEKILKTVKKFENGNNLKPNNPDSEITEDDSEDILDSLFYQEYDKELEELKSMFTPEKFASLKLNIQDFFESVIKEAESTDDDENGIDYVDSTDDDENGIDYVESTDDDEIGIDNEEVKPDPPPLRIRVDYSGNYEVKFDQVESKDDDEVAVEDKNVAYKKLTLGLKKLLKKLDQAKKDVIKTAKGPKDAKSASDDKKDQSIIEDDKDNEEFQMKIRLDRINPNGKTYEMDRIQQKKMEQAIKEKLEKYGVTTEGRKIEVKIIKAGYFGSQLTDHEASQFENMITALLTGEQEAIQEMERNKKMEENYKFTWKNDIEDDEGE